MSDILSLVRIVQLYIIRKTFNLHDKIMFFLFINSFYVFMIHLWHYRITVLPPSGIVEFALIHLSFPKLILMVLILFIWWCTITYRTTIILRRITKSSHISIFWRNIFLRNRECRNRHWIALIVIIRIYWSTLYWTNGWWGIKTNSNWLISAGWKYCCLNSWPIFRWKHILSRKSIKRLKNRLIFIYYNIFH